MEQALAGLHGAVKRVTLEAMQGIVMDERAHVPEERHRLPGHINHGANDEFLPQRQGHDSPPIHESPATTSSTSTEANPQVAARHKSRTSQSRPGPTIMPCSRRAPAQLHTSQLTATPAATAGAAGPAGTIVDSMAKNAGKTGVAITASTTNTTTPEKRGSTWASPPKSPVYAAPKRRSTPTVSSASST